MADHGRQLPVVQPGREPGAAPIFPRIGVVGLGLIGGSIALAARNTWPAGLVVGVDRKDVLERAMVLHAIDVAADDPVVLAEVDLVILAAPVQQNLELLRELPDHVVGTAVITDTGSTKRAMIEAASQLPDRLTYIGGHPLGGAATSGIEHARPDLFAGRPWLFTPSASHDRDALGRLQSFATALGALPRILSPEDHDRVLAYISHLPQITVSALMHVVGEAVGRPGLALSGRGLHDTTRLAGSPAGIWKEVSATNSDELGAALDALIEVLRRLRADLETGDSIETVFDSANRWREALLTNRS